MNAHKGHQTSSSDSSEIITVIPVYNGENYLQATLESIARQTRRPDRLLIIDDGSTDGTEDLVRAFKDIPCEWHPNPQNLGLFPNLNKALEKANEAEFFHLLLADDLVVPEFIETSCQALKDAPPLSFSWSDIQWIDAEGRQAKGTVVDSGRPGAPFSQRTFLTQESELQTVSVGSVMIRTGRQPLPCRFRTDLPQVADCVFYGELASHAKSLIHIPRPLCHIRTHATNMTSKNIQNLKAWVTDEWIAMQETARRIQEGALQRWLRHQKLRCLFAARSKVKEQWMERNQPEYAQQIRKATRSALPLPHFLLGRMSVALRDMIKGRNVEGQAQS
jgi:hypothetical protein